MSHIFISYSKKDIAFARHLRGLLEAQKFRVWMDENDLDPSEDWWEMIEANIIASAAFIVIMSPHAKDSKWVKREILVAEDPDHAKPIYPVLLAGKVWSRLAEIQAEDMTAGVEALLPSRLVRALVQVIAPLVDEPPKVAEPPKLMISPKRGKVEDILPAPFEWCDIPAGSVKIEGEMYEVQPFKMAKYPITNAQFAIFLNDPNGYANDFWWHFSGEATDWRSQHKSIPTLSRMFNGNSQPRVKVSWYEAMAFCNWLSNLSSKYITLPAETQWLYAAQGGMGYTFPWGNQFDVLRCNTSESEMGRTTPVDQYPDGASPFGVVDMAGNVWEWCLNTYGKANSGRRDMHMLRGGSFLDDQLSARSRFRARYAPSEQLDNFGFRIVML